MKQLPGLNDLRVFEAAARLQNFRQAAEALHMTHGAISLRIRALEAQLGVSLFERQNGVRLTDTGRVLFRATESALALLQTAIEQITLTRDGNRSRLRVSTLPSFAAHWLLPRLPDFRQRYPDIALEIETDNELSDLSRDGVDVAIRLGLGLWRGLISEKLFDDAYYPVASPEFIEQHGPILVSGIGELPLIHHAELIGGVSWPDYLRLTGLPSPRLLNVTVFHESSMVLNAAEQGLGIALVRHSIAENAAAAGRLVRLLDTAVSSEFNYFIACLPTSVNLDRVDAFRKWVVDQSRQFAAEHAPASFTKTAVS